MSEETRRKVAQGESVESIAAETGHYWPSLWDHPENGALRGKRQSPHILRPGDELVIPRPRPKTVSVISGAQHAFRRRGIPSRLRLQVMLHWKPRAHEKYVLIVDNKDQVEGCTDEQGFIDCPISPTACAATLEVGEGGNQQTLRLRLRYLDPIDDDSGVKQRLHNLGYLTTADAEEEQAAQEALSALAAENVTNDSASRKCRAQRALVKKHHS